MKVAFFLQSNLRGSEFHQVSSFIDSIDKIRSKYEDIIVIIDNKNFASILKKKNIPYIVFSINLLKRTAFRMHSISALKKILNFFRLYNPLQKILLNEKVDLIIFNSPSYYILFCEKFNYIASIWNTELKTFNNFPEFLNNKFDLQNKIIETIVKYAFKILVFSKKNKIDLVTYYNCPQSKVIIQNLIPYLPNLHKSQKKIVNFQEYFEELLIEKNQKYIFYPAQFWSHKNHIYIIEAAQLLEKNQSTRDYSFIFTGQDKGNLEYIKKLIAKNNLNKKIKIFSYLDNNQIIALYLNCYAVCMPTYVGRSSLPLLESFYFKKVIFYSKGILDEDLEKHVIQCDLKNPNDFVNKIIDLEKNKINVNLEGLYERYCSEDELVENYIKLIDEYNYLSKRWLNKKQLN